MSMKYLGAYLLAAIGGEASPSADKIKEILGAAGMEVEDDLVSLVISKMEGKSVSEVLASGLSNLEAVGGGGEFIICCVVIEVYDFECL